MRKLGGNLDGSKSRVLILELCLFLMEAIGLIRTSSNSMMSSLLRIGSSLDDLVPAVRDKIILLTKSNLPIKFKQSFSYLLLN